MLHRFLYHRLRWLNLPAIVLVALLQRTPVLRVAAMVEERLLASSTTALLRSAIGTVASLGSMHALAGATQFTFNRQPPISATAGVAMAPLVFSVTGALHPAGSYRVMDLPPGLSLTGADSNGVLTASSGFITGTPTEAGTFTTTILAYEHPNAAGDVFGPHTVVFFISEGAAMAPAFTTQPSSQAATIGSAVTFTANANGSPAPTYQWSKDGVSISGATNASLSLPRVRLVDAGDYSVVAANSAGTVTSAVAKLTIVPVEAAARLTNLSVRTAMAAGQTLIVGVVVSDGSRDVLVRAAGPALAAFGLSTAMLDPRLDLYSGTSVLLSNNDWPASLEPMFTSVGAFGFPANSRDAAFVRSMNAGYSIQARGTGPGVVLVEAYDTGAATAARLVNVSARNRVGTGDDILIAGFTITGSGAKRLLLRAVGPRLAAFGVTGFLTDPKLEVYDAGGVKVAENDDWPAALAATFASVSAFELINSSRDAALVVTLSSGSYTAQVRGVDGGTGEALIEIYELK